MLPIRTAPRIARDSERRRRTQSVLDRVVAHINVTVEGQYDSACRVGVRQPFLVVRSQTRLDRARRVIQGNGQLTLGELYWKEVAR